MWYCVKNAPTKSGKRCLRHTRLAQENKSYFPFICTLSKTCYPVQNRDFRQAHGKFATSREHARPMEFSHKDAKFHELHTLYVAYCIKPDIWLAVLTVRPSTTRKQRPVCFQCKKQEQRNDKTWKKYQIFVSPKTVRLICISISKNVTANV